MGERNKGCDKDSDKVCQISAYWMARGWKDGMVE
jgi:hypothetical protein